MARSITQHYDALVAEKQSLSTLSALQPAIDDSQTLLTDLTNTSRVSRWRLLLWLMAFAMWMHEVAIEVLVANGIFGTVRWYRQIGLEYQHGYPLSIINGKPQYATVDTSDSVRVVKLCSVVERQDGGILMKVAGIVGGTPAPVTVMGFTAAFSAYMKMRKFAGPRLTVINLDADVMRLEYRVYYDPLLLDPDGQLIAEPGVYPVTAAITAYLQQQNVTNFDGRFYADELTARIKAAKGVSHAVAVAIGARASYETTYTNVLAAADNGYNPEAGYLSVSVATGETLDDTIHYLPAP